MTAQHPCPGSAAGPGSDAAPGPRVRPWLAVSPAVLSADGGQVALIPVNPTGRELWHGPLGRLQRADGDGWADHRQLTTGMGPDRPPGKLYPLDAEIMVPAIALTVAPHGFGAPVWSRLRGLGPGHYRVVLGEAAGVLEIARDAPPTPARPTGPYLLTGTSVVAAGRPATLDLRLRVRDPLTDPGPAGAWSGAAVVERARPGGWTRLSAQEVGTLDPAEGADSAHGFSVVLAAPEPGIHRVGRRATNGSAGALFWVLPID